MKNAQPRFALEDDGNIYDYQTSKSLAPTGTLTDDNGVWDLSAVAALLAIGKSVEGALISLAVRKAPKKDKVAKANEDFLAEGPQA